MNGNTGLHKRTAENREAIDSAEFEKKRQEIENVAVYYTDYLIKYIQKHKANYTCYVCDGLTTLIDDTNATGVATDYDLIVPVTEATEILNRENNG
jgi:hypothetical protein